MTGHWREIVYDDFGLDPHTREGRARLSILFTVLLFGTGGLYAFIEWL